MANGSDSITEITVDAAAVVKLMVGVTGRALVLDPTDATDADDEDDEHQDKGNAQSPYYYVERVTRHVGQ